MILSSRVALAYYKDLKANRRRTLPKEVPPEHLIRETLQELSHSILWPFRIVLAMPDDGSPLFHVVLNHGGQGNDEPIWTMRGWHREKDVIHLTVIFRNLLYSGGAGALEFRQIDGGLSYAMREVAEVMATYPDADEDAASS